jgi:SAM-dependent methyltransferase
VASVVAWLFPPRRADRILDVGSGSGALVRALRAAGFRAAGVDLAPKRAEPWFLRGDAGRLPVAGGTCDFVYCCDVVEHLTDADLDACLSEIRRILRPRGRLCVATRNEERLDEAECQCPSCGTRFHRFGHQQVFSATRLRGAVERHGFACQRVRTCTLEQLVRWPWMRWPVRLGAYPLPRRFPLFHEDLVVLFTRR